MSENETHSEFVIAGTWTGTMQDGRGELGASGLRVTHSVPEGFGGHGVGTNPEELLAAAASSCALITLSAVLGAQGAAAPAAQCVTTARFEHSKTGPKAASLTHEISLRTEVPGVDLDRIARMVERNCMVSQALAGNVPVEVRLVSVADTVVA